MPISRFTPCSVDDCDGPMVARGWCDKHYRRWKKTGDPLHTARIIGDDRARFFSHVDRRGDDDCWPWLGSHNAPRNGTPYGTFRFANRTRPAHVVSYLLAHDEDAIPPDMVLDHLCRVTLCVNPAHLEPVTQQENIYRGRLTKISPERVAELARLRDSGVSVASLARGEGVTPTALSMRFKRLAESASAT